MAARKRRPNTARARARFMGEVLGAGCMGDITPELGWRANEG
jgi:hypothetical protein